MTAGSHPAAPEVQPSVIRDHRRGLAFVVGTLRSNAAGVAGVVVLGTFGAIAFLAPLLAPFDPTSRVAAPFTSPGGAHRLGTNDIGQDIFSELIYGTRISLGVAVTIALFATGVGCLVGLPAGYSRGRLPGVLMRVVDVVMVLPFLPLMLLIAAIYGPGIRTQVIVIGLLLWARPARVIRASVLGIRSAGHIEAAEWTGASSLYVMRRHVLPRITPVIVAEFVRAANVAILLEAGLAFLGLGDPVAKSWGMMLHYAQARAALLTGAWLYWVIPPGLCIAAVVLGFALVGLALEQVTDPRLRRRDWLGTS